MSDSVRPHRRQPTRLPHPWDSPGKNTGVGCHFLLQCIKVKSESEVAQSCLTLSDPMDCRLPGSSVHGIFPGKRTGVECHCLLHAYGHVYLTHLPTLKTELLFYCWIVRVFTYSGYKSFIRDMICKYFPPFCGISDTFLMSFEAQKF